MMMKRVEVEAGLGVPTDVIAVPRDDDHPIIVGTSKGYVLLYRIDAASHSLVCVRRWRPGRGSVRRLCLLSPSTLLVSSSGGKIRSLDVGAAAETESVLLTCGQDLGVVSSLVSWEADKQLFFLGNDEGDVHVCRLHPSKREITVLKSFDHHDDYISSLAAVAAKKTLFVASGDGTLSVIDLKKSRVTATSKNFDEDVTALALIPLTSKVFLGLGSGEVKALRWNYWGAPCDSLKPRFHNRAAINDMIAIEAANSASLLITANDDGVLRLVPAIPLSSTAELASVEDSFERLAWIPKGKRGELLGTLIAITAGEAALYVIPITQGRVDAALTPATTISYPVSSSSGHSSAEEGEGEGEDRPRAVDDEEDEDDRRYSSVSAGSKQKRARPSTGTAAQSFFQDLD